jgi:hypothetical protein
VEQGEELGELHLRGSDARIEGGLVSVNKTEAAMATRVRERLQLLYLPFQEEPYEVQERKTLPEGDLGATFAYIPLPPGKLFVIEYVSAYISAPAGQWVNTLVVDTFNRSGLTRHYFYASRTSEGEPDTDRGDTWIVSQQTRLYAEANPDLHDAIFVGIGRDSPDGEASFHFSLTGYMRTRIARPVPHGEPIPPYTPKAPVAA